MAKLFSLRRKKKSKSKSPYKPPSKGSAELRARFQRQKMINSLNRRFRHPIRELDKVNQLHSTAQEVFRRRKKSKSPSIVRVKNLNTGRSIEVNARKQPLLVGGCRMKR